MSLRIRRGTDAQRSGITFDMGEIVWTTDGQQLWVGDGLTQGGFPVVGANIAGFGLAYDPVTRRIEVSGLSADDITNGVNNKFFATELAQDAAASLFVTGTHSNISFVYDDSLGKINATVTLDGTGISDIVADTSPQLGGDLDLNINDITGTGNITIDGFIESVSVSANQIVTDELTSGVINSPENIEINYTENATFNGRNIIVSNASVASSAPLAAGLIFLSSRGTVSEPTAVQLGDKVSSYSGAGWNGSEYSTLGGISIGASTGTTGTESLPGLITIFTRDDNGGTESFAQLDGNGVFSARAVQTFGLTTTQKTTLINKFGGAGTGEDFVKGTIVYDTTINKLSVFHPTEGWGNILTSTSPVASTSYFKVGVFADNTARNTAVGTPSAGMIVFNTTSGNFEGYNGTAWVALN